MPLPNCNDFLAGIRPSACLASPGRNCRRRVASTGPSAVFTAPAMIWLGRPISTPCSISNCSARFSPGAMRRQQRGQGGVGAAGGGVLQHAGQRGEHAGAQFGHARRPRPGSRASGRSDGPVGELRGAAAEGGQVRGGARQGVQRGDLGDDEGRADRGDQRVWRRVAMSRSVRPAQAATVSPGCAMSIDRDARRGDPARRRSRRRRRAGCGRGPGRRVPRTCSVRAGRRPWWRGHSRCRHWGGRRTASRPCG